MVISPLDALGILTRAALAPYPLEQGPAAQMQSIVTKALANPAGDVAQLIALKAERTELTLRVAELEDELLEASKPKRKSNRKTDDAA
jgi:hypothetical protein